MYIRHYTWHDQCNINIYTAMDTPFNSVERTRFKFSMKILYCDIHSFRGCQGVKMLGDTPR